MSVSHEHQLLTAALRLPQIPWVFNFFFNTEPQIHLSMLHTSASLAPTLTLNTQVTFRSTASSALESDSLVELLHLPVFTKDDITVGYVVTECLHSTNIGLASTSPTYSPFARDNANVVYFSVRQYPRQGYVEIDCVDFSTSIVRAKLTMRFAYDAFHASLDYDAEGLRIDEARRALIYLVESNDERDCVLCHASSGLRCTCVSKRILLRSPRTPSDVSQEAFNFAQGLGSSRGNATLTLFRDGIAVFSALLRQDIRLCGRSDSRIRQNLARCAVSKLMDAICLHPAATAMSYPALLDRSRTRNLIGPPPLEQSTSVQIGQIGCSIDALALENRRTERTSSARRARNLSLCRYYNEFHSNQHTGVHSIDSVDISTHWCVNCVTEDNLPMAVSLPVSCSPRCANSLRRRVPVQLQDTFHESQQKRVDGDPASPSDTLDCSGSPDDIGTSLFHSSLVHASRDDSSDSREEQYDQRVEPKLENDLVDSCTRERVQEGTVEKTVEHDPKAKVETDDVEAGDEKGLQRSKEEQEWEERQRKNCARREKNREAARRSNAKKAAYLRNLRSNLSEVSRKKHELSQKLTMLTEENLRLRQTANLSIQGHDAAVGQRKSRVGGDLGWPRDEPVDK